MGNTIMHSSTFSNTSLVRKPCPTCQLMDLHVEGRVASRSASDRFCRKIVCLVVTLRSISKIRIFPETADERYVTEVPEGEGVNEWTGEGGGTICRT